MAGLVTNSLITGSRFAIFAVSVTVAFSVESVVVESGGIGVAVCGPAWFWPEQNRIIELESSFVNKGTRVGATGD